MRGTSTATRRGGFGLGVVVDDATRDACAGDLRNEPRGAVDRVPREVVTDPLLVAHARLGAEAKAAGRVADRRPVEDRRFEDDPRRPLPHLGRGAAHDPGKADRPLAIGDDEHLVVELALDVIDRHQCLPLARPADDDLASGNRVGVIGMHRLAELMHHVVRDVHHRADRPHPGRDQPALHPVRRRSVRHAVEPARREPWIELRLPRCGRWTWPAARHRPRRRWPLGGAVTDPVKAATSRARPTISSASPRFGLTSTSMHRSPTRVGERRAEGDLVAVAQDVDAVAIGPRGRARPRCTASRC